MANGTGEIAQYYMDEINDLHAEVAKLKAQRDKLLVVLSHVRMAVSLELNPYILPAALTAKVRATVAEAEAGI